MIVAFIRIPQNDGSYRVWQYDGDAMSCSEADASFGALSEAEKIAQTTTVAPNVPDGSTGFVVRDCENSGAGNEGDEPAAYKDLSEEVNVAYSVPGS